MKKLLFLYNPHSGKTTIKTQMANIIDVYSKAGFFTSVYATQYKGHLTKLILEYGKDYQLLVVSGGDGTLNEAVAAIMQLPEDIRPRLGYIPGGSTNDYARSLGIPRSSMRAAKRTIEGDEVVADVGKIKDRPFIYVACFGMLTEVTYLTPQQTKNILGHQAYILEAAKRLASIKPKSAMITYKTIGKNNEEEEKLIQGDFLYGMVTNSRSVAGIPNVTGKSVRINDGLFEMTLVRVPKTPIDYTDAIKALLSSEESEYVIRAKVSYVRVVSDQEISWVIDGEHGGDVKSAEIEVIPKAFRIMV